MPLTKIVTYPDPLLLESSLPVVVFDGALRKLCSDLTDAMYMYDNAIGLSAVQVGTSLRIFVLNCGLAGAELVPTSATIGPTIFINPELSWVGEARARGPEGCLSLPGVSIAVERPSSVRVRAATIEGVLFEVQADGIYARAVQHELDHLDGKLLLSYAGYTKREMVKKKLSKGKR